MHWIQCGLTEFLIIDFVSHSKGYLSRALNVCFYGEFIIKNVACSVNVVKPMHFCGNRF